MVAGEHTLREIFSQPQVWAESLAAFDLQDPQLQSLLEAGAFDQVIVTGCGSTYYLALTAARLLRKAGSNALACPASELLLHPESIYLPGQRSLLLSVSRSGSTTETVRALEQFQANAGGPVIAVSCDSGSPLARGADFVIAIDAAQEKSVAQTRSFSSMAVVLQQLAALLGGHNLAGSRRLPALCRDLLADYADLVQSLGQNDAISKFFFLGSDALYGIACEAMLKMKEMSLSYSEAYHTLEFRHGPMSMVGEDSLVVGLLSPEAARQEQRVLKEMAAMGATVLAIGQDPGPHQRKITLPSDLPAWCTPVLYLPALQMLAYQRAIFTGCDPDQPHQLSAVVSLDNI